MSETKSQVLCISCSIFRNELEALRKKGSIDLSVHYLDSRLHMHPPKLQHLLDNLIVQTRQNGTKALLLYGDCHSHMQKTETRPGVARVQGFNCVEIFLGRDLYRKLRAEKVFFFCRSGQTAGAKFLRMNWDLSVKRAKILCRKCIRSCFTSIPDRYPFPQNT